MALSDSFEHFRSELAEKIEVGEATGMSSQEMKKRAVSIGNWLANEVDPRNHEQRLLKELWEVADDSEQQAIASSLFKLAKEAAPVK